MMDTVFIYDADCLFVVGMHAFGLHMLRGDPDTLYGVMTIYRPFAELLEHNIIRA